MSFISYLCSPPYLWWIRAKAAINRDQVACCTYTCVHWDARTRQWTCTPHTHMHPAVYTLLSAASPWFTELKEGGQNPAGGIYKKVSQCFRTAGLEETSRGHSIHSMSLERTASLISLLGSVFVTNPQRHPAREIVPPIPAAVGVCCSLAHFVYIPVAAGHGAVLVVQEPSVRGILNMHSTSHMPEDRPWEAGALLFLQMASGFQPKYTYLP